MARGETRTALLRARDVMTAEPTCVEASASLPEAARLLDEHAISGLPVIDTLGRVCGMVTRADLLRRILAGSPERAPAFLFELLRETGEEDRAFAAEDATTVAEIMSEDPACVAADAPVEAIAHLLATRRIHRVVVTDRTGLPMGIVTTLDLLARWPDAPSA